MKECIGLQAPVSRPGNCCHMHSRKVTARVRPDVHPEKQGQAGVAM